MARYNLIYDADARLISIEDMKATLPKGSRVVSTLVFPEDGKAPSASEPNPRQHLTNVATMINVPFEELTIVNNTENKKLDDLEKYPSKGPNAERNKERQILSSKSGQSGKSDDSFDNSDTTSKDTGQQNKMDHDGDGKPGGSLSGDQSTAHKGAVARHEREAEERQQSQSSSESQPQESKIEETTS